VAGLLRSFRAVNLIDRLLSSKHEESTIQGGGSPNIDLELVKNFRSLQQDSIAMLVAGTLPARLAPMSLFGRTEPFPGFARDRGLAASSISQIQKQ